MDSVLISSLILFGTFFIFLFSGVPISIGIGLSSMLTIFSVVPFDLGLFSAAQKAFTGIDSFSLLAIPFFMLSGNIMNKGGIALRLINLAKLVGGRLHGSLAHANVVGNMLFGSISGSSIAAAAAVGGTMAPLQKEEGYDKAYSAAVNIASAPTGILIPPSGPLILFSLVSGGTSISALFMAGYIPGIMMGLAVMIIAWYQAKKWNYPIAKPLPMNEKIKVIIDAIPSLMLIVIVIGGIAKGVFTATEGAAVSVVYSLVLSLIYKTISLKELPKLMGEAMVVTAGILLLIAASGIMSWVMAFTGIPQTLSSYIIEISNNKYVIFLIMNIILLIVGTFMDLTPAVLIFTPIFLPIATTLGMHPVHFGIMMIFNLGMGNMTPPVGSVLFVGCKVGEVTIEEVTKPLLPYFIILILTLLLVTYIPFFSMVIPEMLGLI